MGLRADTDRQRHGHEYGNGHGRRPDTDNDTETGSGSLSFYCYHSAVGASRGGERAEAGNSVAATKRELLFRSFATDTEPKSFALTGHTGCKYRIDQPTHYHEVGTEKRHPRASSWVITCH